MGTYSLACAAYILNISLYLHALPVCHVSVFTKMSSHVVNPIVLREKKSA